MELLTVKETAEILRVSQITVRRYIASGQLAAERVGRGIRVRREAIDEFMMPVVSRAPHRELYTSSRKPARTARYSEDDIVEIGSLSSPGESVWVPIDLLDEYMDEHAAGTDDSLWNIVGIGRSDDPNDVASNKHKYLADAILASRSDDLADSDVDEDEEELPTVLEALGISVGIGRSGEPTNIAEHKDEYLADAFEAKG